MSDLFNSSASFINDNWSGYLAQAPQINTRYLILALVNIPVLAVVLNVLQQLILPKDPTKPPLVFHWLPFIGSGVQYGHDPLNFFFNCQKKYGDCFTFILFGRKVTVLLGAQGNNFVLGGKSTVFNAEDAYTHLTTPIFGDDVVYAIPNEIFMEQKKFVKWGLHTEAFRSYAGLIEQEVHDFIQSDPAFKEYQRDDITEWGSADILKLMAQITILTASRTLQGKTIRSRLDKSFAEVFQDLDGGFTPVNFLFPNLPLPNYRARDQAHKKITQFYMDIIRERRENRAGDDVEYDIVNALRDQKYRSGRPVADSEIAHILIALLMAGQHTSQSTASWSILHIAHDPKLAAQIYDEQVKKFGKPDGTFSPITYDEVKELPILDSVIRETLRLHPPIHSILRHVRDDVPVPPTLAAPSKDGTYIIPKGYYVLASPSMSQNDPTVWANAEEFDYRRWTDSDGFAAQALKEYVDETGEKIDFGFGAVSKGTLSPYQPFGAGRHRCIGEQFAYLQIGTILSTLIQEFEFRLDGPVPPNNYHTMIAAPDAPRTVHYRRRRHA
ncbi:lanosterol 14-alpha-demethylase [Hymenopellis radicata]|nr:lanosterol 14-alpha-demethylase [Hymenopellis radicata]